MYTLQQIVNTLKANKQIVYTEPNRLNIVGIRTGNVVSEVFDDFLAFFYYDENGNLKGKVCQATTDPSVHFLNSPMNSAGTAILKSGQYVDTYKLGLHRQKYEALVQSKNVTVIRDSDRDSLLNFFAKTEKGLFGVNIHRASRGKNNDQVIGLDSAGCQVFRYEADFNEMMRLARISSAKYGNNFTYTLIDEKDVVKKVRNYAIIGVGIILMTISAYFYKKMRK